MRDRQLLTYCFSSPIEGTRLRIGFPLARLRSTLATSFAVRWLSRCARNGVDVEYTYVELGGMYPEDMSCVRGKDCCCCRRGDTVVVRGGVGSEVMRKSCAAKASANGSSTAMDVEAIIAARDGGVEGA